MLLLFASAFLLFGITSVNSLENGLARTPPMGWMSWERFRCELDCVNFPGDCIAEPLIMRIADALVSDGYKEAGYEYVIIDDCWSELERDKKSGKLVPHRERFPNGMKYIGDYIHSKGLKFGLYQDYGTKTCGGYPGILGHEELDAKTFAEWEVDYVKLDGCNSDPRTMDEGYINFGKLLNATGRSMVYSCSWPFFQEQNGITPNFTLIKEHCNLWRIYIDIQDSWDSIKKTTKYLTTNQYTLQPIAGPGHWNDPDMLLIGNFGLSIEQSKAQMAIWAILAAPLLMSTDLNNIRSEFKEILLNKEIIQVNQDPLGIQGKRIKIIDNIEIWTRPIKSKSRKNSSYAVAFVSLRTDGKPYRLSVNLSEINLQYTGGYRQTDLFNKTAERKLVKPSTTITVNVNPSGCEFFKFSALKKKKRSHKKKKNIHY